MMRASSSRAMPRSTGSTPASREQREQHRPVRVADLPGGERALLDELVAGREHADARPRVRRRPRRRRGSRARPTCAGRSDRARGEHELARDEVAAGGPDVVAGARPRARRAPRRRRRAAVRSTITIASAPSGIGAPVMIRIASPGPTGIVGAAPAGRSPTTRSRTRRRFGRARGVGGADRVPVHRGVRERRDRLRWSTTSAASTSPSASRPRPRDRGERRDRRRGSRACASLERDERHVTRLLEPALAHDARARNAASSGPRSGRSSASSMLARRKSTFWPMS